MEKQKELEGLLLHLNTCYREGEPKVSDAEYDSMCERLKIEFPESELLKKAVLETSSVDRMQELPYPMFSLDKIKTVEEFEKWLISCDYKEWETLVVTPKLDGISILKDSLNQRAWTRGNGVEGQIATSHYKHTRSSTYKDHSCSWNYVYGEAIISRANFDKLKSTPIDGREYKVARNAVAGMFNSPIAPKEALSFVDFIPCGLDREDWSKMNQLVEMRGVYGKDLPCESFFFDDVPDFSEVLDWFTELYEKWSIEYCIDGLVIDFDSAQKRMLLGRGSNNNPRYSIAFKSDTWQTVRITTVQGIELNVGKDGNVAPVILIDPVEIGGATISRVTGNNMKYVLSQRIAKGSVIEMTRSGEVIAKHLKTLSFEDGVDKRMVSDIICPTCGIELVWDATQTEMVCRASYCPGRILSSIVHFFTTMEFEDFGRPTIEKLFVNGYTSVGRIFNITLQELLLIEGFGHKSATNLINQLEKLKREGASAARLMTALNVFQGKIAEKTCQSILDGVSEEVLNEIKNFQMVLEEDLIDVPGIGWKTASEFKMGLRLYSHVSSFHVPISKWNNPKIEAATNQLSVCFTGVRDKALEAQLTEGGHKIVSGVSRSTTHLVVKDLGTGSSKSKKAKELNVPIVTLEEFKKLL